MSRDSLFDTISELVGCHSPSGNEAEIDRLLLERLDRVGEPIVDGGGNIVLRRSGREPGPLRVVGRDELHEAADEELLHSGKCEVSVLSTQSKR